MARSAWEKTEEGKEWTRKYSREYMRKKRDECPSYCRNTWLELGYAFKTFSKHPEYLLCKHPLAICSDAHPAFKDAVDPHPDPFEACCLAEEAA